MFRQSEGCVTIPVKGGGEKGMAFARVVTGVVIYYKNDEEVKGTPCAFWSLKMM